jgi:DNA-binding beta-propeller fold protein YncE
MGCSSISVRGLAAIAAVCAVFCLGATSASAAPLVWTSNTSAGSVSTTDGATGKEVGKPIPVGEEPAQIAITPDGRRAIVLELADQSARVIETATRTVLKPIPLGALGQYIAISPDGQVAYVTAVGDSEVLVIDPETARLVDSFPVGPELTEVAFSPDGTYAYVGTGSEDVVRVDVGTQEVVGAPIAVGGTARSIAFSPDGETAYVVVDGIKGVKVIDTALGEVVKTIPTAEVPGRVAVSPDGKRFYISTETPGALSTAETANDTIVGKSIPVPAGVREFAIAPDGKTAWAVAEGALTPIDLVAGRAKPAILTGEVDRLAITPDQSPTAAFTAPSAIAGTPALFSGVASSDPDGTIASYSWAFGDGGVGSGVGPSHTYGAPGTYDGKLSVVDSEGCGEAEVFTGHTAYCSGGASSVAHPVTAKALPAAPISTVEPSNSFRFGALVHNRHNGTARLQVKLPSAGIVLLFGKKVHEVTRKSKGVQSMWLTIHARVELNKRLKTVLRAPVKVRVTFTPSGGTPKSVNRTVTLQRTPRHGRARH